MVARNTGESATADREIVTTRLFGAPRERVFDAWTDRAQIGRWFGPNGFTTTTAEMDVRPAGVWRFVMHGPDGIDYPNVVRYLEVVRPERLVYDHGSDEGTDDQFRNTITFDDEGGKTRLTMRALFATAEERDRVVEEHGAIEGGKQTLARMAEFLASA